jgi:hypothetical protein
MECGQACLKDSMNEVHRKSEEGKRQQLEIRAISIRSGTCKSEHLEVEDLPKASISRASS